MYRDLLVHVDGSEAGRRRVQIAVNLATRTGAQLTGLHVTPPADVPRRYKPSRVAGVAAKMAVGLASDARAAEMIFREETITDLPDAHWLEAEGHVVQGIDDKARYADLIILGQYECEGEPETHPLPIAHSIVVKCGRPVLVVPSIVQPRERLRIAIAWDGSREAVRATHDALPLLRMAESVQIVTIIPPSADHDHFDTTSLPVHLAKHEINVRPEIIKVSTAKKHELFQKLIAQGDYDLLVMGAHSHPLLDYFFGGATKSILFSSQIPVFVSL